MNILVVNPNTTAEQTQFIDERAKGYARPGTKIQTINPSDGPPYLIGFYDHAIGIYHLLETLRKNRGKYDGYLIACYGDPGLYAARCILDAPVVGVAEASLHMACMLAFKFGILASTQEGIPLYEELLKLHGLEDRCAAVSVIEYPVLDVINHPDEALSPMAEAGRQAIKAGAEALCLGSAGLGLMDKRLEKVLGVPVLDGVVCGVKILEGMIDYGVKPSRIRAFKEPKTGL
jgi:allantoin racemase